MKMFVLKSFVLMFFACSITACTYNISMAHTSGTAEDVIDDNASNNPNLSPTVTVPMTPGSMLQVEKQ